MLLGLLIGLGLGCGQGEHAAAPLRLAGAADLAPVLPELIELHGREFPGEVVATLGSSGLLARQIAEGAPFDLFFSADAAFVDDLIAQGHAFGESRALYARGRIVLWTPASGVEPPKGLADLVDGRFRRIAIANPEHAPYGRAAQQALRAVGLWEQLEPRLVLGDNVLHTLQLCRSGNAEVSIVALSLAMAAPDGAWVLLDETLHEPIDQALAITSASTRRPEAEAFVRTLASPEGRRILARFGFVLPGESLDHGLLEAAGGRLAR